MQGRCALSVGDSGGGGGGRLVVLRLWCARHCAQFQCPPQGKHCGVRHTHARAELQSQTGNTSLLCGVVAEDATVL